MTPAIIAALAEAEEKLKDARVALDRLVTEMQAKAVEWNTKLADANAIVYRCEGEVRALTALVKTPDPVTPLSDDALHGRA
jgi:phage shock protein A